jgi:hypothetical protein
MPAVLKRVLNDPFHRESWRSCRPLLSLGPLRERSPEQGLDPGRPLSKHRLSRLVSLARESIGDVTLGSLTHVQPGTTAPVRIDLLQPQSPFCVLRITNLPFRWVAVASALSIECFSSASAIPGDSGCGVGGKSSQNDEIKNYVSDLGSQIESLWRW